MQPRVKSKNPGFGIRPRRAGWIQGNLPAVWVFVFLTLESCLVDPLLSDQQQARSGPSAQSCGLWAASGEVRSRAAFEH